MADAKDEIYKTERRSQKSTKSKRRGPSLEEHSSSTKESEVLGKLFLGNNPNYHRKNEDISGLAGSNELLAYFHRLAGLDNQNELIDVDYITALIAAGADINVADLYGQTILHAAARDWHPDVAKFLIENGADVNKLDSFGRSPIFIAASLDYPEMLEFLAKNGADINKKTFGEKQTPLHYAAKNDAISSIKCLLNLGADLSAKDYKERVPLYIAVYHGCEDAAQHFLDIGCPAAVFDRDGESAIAMMIEKMPLTAQSALSQFMIVDKITGKKQYFLGALHSVESEMNQGKSVLELIVKYSELELLCHPVIQRLMEVYWDLYAYRNAVTYLLINIIYLLLLSALAILAAAIPNAFQIKYYWNIIIALIVLLLTVVFVIEQSLRLRYTQKSEQIWKKRRIENLEEDLRYCHPQWPHEKEMIEAQISAYTSMVGDHFKNIWHYLDWLTALSILVLYGMRGVNYLYENDTLHFAVHVNLTVTVFLAWLRFLKSVKVFRVVGQFIALLRNIIIATGQFAFLFMIFFIPFTVAFWILFGGEENAAIIHKKVSAKLSDAFRKYNDAVYSVWTLTVVVGFPMKAIKAIDKQLAKVYVSIYYFFMSVVCLNLFIALLSQVFANVYSDAFKNALYEQARSMLAGKAFQKASQKRGVLNFIQKTCNPLTEKLGFRETKPEPNEADEIKLKKVKQEAQRLIKHFNEKTNGTTKKDQSFTMKKIQHEFSAIERNQNDFEAALTTLQKLKVENKKIVKLLGLQVKSQTQ